MKRQMLFGTMLSMALAVGLSAQEPQTPPAGGQSQPPTGQTQPPRPSPSQPSSTERTMTLTGCIQAGSGAAATTPSAEPGAPGEKGGQRAGFTLTDISPAGAASPGTAGTSGAAATASSYRLTGGENLQQYVGKRVEVTGSVSGRAGSSATGAAASEPASFRVTSVKPATGECK